MANSAEEICLAICPCGLARRTNPEVILETCPCGRGIGKPETGWLRVRMAEDQGEWDDLIRCPGCGDIVELGDWKGVEWPASGRMTIACHCGMRYEVEQNISVEYRTRKVEPC
jgi:hypothetical protein